MKVAVIGLGYVGLPLALLSAKKGVQTVGFEVSEQKARQLQDGVLYLREEKYLPEWFAKARENFRATTDENDISDCTVKIVCVPTPIDKEKMPNLDYVRGAVEIASRNINDGDLIIIESTIHPGTCEEVVKPILEKSGKKYLLAHCPERINPGDKKWNVSNIPRVIGGIDDESAQAAKKVYDHILDSESIIVQGIKEAEATKILENTFRDVNIAFINEMAQSFYRMGINIKEVIKGSSTKPFAFMPHYPGVGVGGHCIAVDPYYMIQKGKESGFDHDFLINARRINAGMPAYAVKMMQNMLNELGLPVKGTRIAVLGVAYKAGVADDRESPSYQVIRRLKNKQADLIVYDPYLPEKSNAGTLNEALHKVQCVFICTDHKEFTTDQSIYKDIPLIIDGRNCLDKELIETSGSVYRGIGIR